MQFAHLIERQRDRMNRDAQVRMAERAQRLQLARHRDRHLASRRIEIARNRAPRPGADLMQPVPPSRQIIVSDISPVGSSNSPLTCRAIGSSTSASDDFSPIRMMRYGCCATGRVLTTPAKGYHR